MRLLLLTCAVLLLAPAGEAAAQETQHPPAAYGGGPESTIIGPLVGHANSPILRQLISLDLRDATFEEALEEISRQIGGRLMYDETVASIQRRVTLHEKDILAGQALARLVRGTGLEVVVPAGGSVVLLKRAAPEAAVKDSVTVRGRVVDAASSEPIAQVAVAFEGTGRQTVTNDDGVFVLVGLPAGRQTLSFHRIGYRSTTLTLNLAAGQDTVVVVSLAQAPVNLGELVTTISGNRMRYEVGNSIPVIDAAKEVENHAFNNLSDLLAGRANGLMTVTSSGSANAPSRHRIRGINSILASNDPIVIVDGVRAANGFLECMDAGIPTCDQLPSRFDDFDIDDIESVEILKGPSAAAMWGSDAANGVIVIKTKRGRPGPARWTVKYEEGFSIPPTAFRVPTQGLGKPANGTVVTRCPLTDQVLGRCVPIDSVAGGFNRFEHPRTTSVAMGRSRDVGASVSGGSESMQYYLSAGYRDDLGMSKMPEIDQKLVREALGQPLPDWMVRPDAKEQISVSGRLTGTFSDKLDYSVNAKLMQVESRNGPDGLADQSTSDLRSVADTFELSKAWQRFYVERKYRVNRFVGALALNWRPTSWFSGRAAVGRDYVYTDAAELRRQGWCLPFCLPTSNDAKGYVEYGDGQELVQHVDLSGTLRFPVLDGRVVLTTAFGAQHLRNKESNINAYAIGLPPGRIDLSAGNERYVLQGRDDRASLGTYIEQSVALNDRLFVNGALRRDISSALGEEVAPIYPKMSVSWLVSDEPFFPLREHGVSLRLRGALGMAGVQPRSVWKYRTFTQAPHFIEPDGTYGSNYGTVNGIGNADLRPERSREAEGGFELGLWNDRLILDFTYFDKYTSDAIVTRPLAPSLGVSGSQYYNIGDVRNRGMEAFLTARIIDRPEIQWDLNVGFATRDNELVSLGPGVEPFSITASNIDLATVMDNDAVVMPGYPLFGRWARPVIGYSDANGDGIIVPSEVKVADTLVYMGSSLPKADISVRPEVGFWNNRLRLSAAFEYVHELTQLNAYAASAPLYRMEMYDPKTPLHVQACYVVAATYGNNYCFYETVSVLRLRNLSLGITAPDRFARLVGARSATFHVMGTNLGVWTDYYGLDPMVNTEGASGNRLVGGAALPRPVTWSFRVQLGY